MPVNKENIDITENSMNSNNNHKEGKYNLSQLIKSPLTSEHDIIKSKDLNKNDLNPKLDIENPKKLNNFFNINKSNIQDPQINKKMKNLNYLNKTSDFVFKEVLKTIAGANIKKPKKLSIADFKC